MGNSVLITTMILQMKQSFARPMFRFCLIANPILNTILLYEMFRNSGEENFASYVILGAGLMGIWSCICFSSAGDINRERYSGTLSLVFAAPAGFAKIILGKILGNTILSLTTLAISLATAVILYQTPIVLVSPGYFVIAFAAMIMSFVVFSSILACLLTLSRRTTLYMNCIEIPFILLCGLSFPIEILPQWVQSFSYLLAPTWAVELLRMAVAGVEDINVFWKKMMVLIILSMMGAVFSAWLYRKIDKQVRIHASLEVC
ncbi:MAG: ABC transporter permease [Roseburia sp.]|nr:ABC transporter permease [Roseburia sp.]